MPGWKKRIEQIQKKPYKTKIKILRAGIAAAFILLVILWIITLNLRNSASETPEQYSKFREIWENLKSIDFKF